MKLHKIFRYFCAEEGRRREAPLRRLGPSLTCQLSTGAAAETARGLQRNNKERERERERERDGETAQVIDRAVW